MGKKEPLTDKTLRQLSILEEYYSVDKRNRVVAVSLRYEKAEEIVYSNLSCPGKPKIRKDVIEEIAGIVSEIPSEFSVHLSLQVDDCQGYDYNTLLNSICGALELSHYTNQDDKRHKTSKSAMIMIVGLIILTFWGVLEVCMSGLEADKEIVTKEFLNILAGALLYEAAVWVFLEARDSGTLEDGLMNSINVASMLDGSGRTVCSITKKDMTKDWRFFRSRDKMLRAVVLIIGVIRACLVVMWFGESLIYIREMFGVLSGAFLAVNIISMAGAVVAGIGAVSLYRGRGPLRRAVLPAAVVQLLSEIVLIVMIYTNLQSGGISVGLSGKIVIIFSIVIGLVFVALIPKINKSDKAKESY